MKNSNMYKKFTFIIILSLVFGQNLKADVLQSTDKKTPETTKSDFLKNQRLSSNRGKNLLNSKEAFETEQKKLESAKIALENGMLSIARDCLNVLIKSKYKDISNRSLLLLGSLLLSQKELQLSESYLRQILSNLKSKNTRDISTEKSVKLRLAFISLINGENLRAKTYSNDLSDSDFEKEDLPWFYLLKGFLTKDNLQSNNFFDLAIKNSQNSLQKQSFESAISREKTFRGAFKEDFAKSFKEKISSANSAEEKYTFLKEYLFALYRFDKKAEIVKTIDDFLKNVKELKLENKTEIILLKSVLLREIDRSIDNTTELLSVFEKTNDKRIYKIAFDYLIQSEQFSKHIEQSQAFLEKLISKKHPFSTQLSYLKLLLLIEKKQWDLAENLCHDILKIYSSRKISHVKKDRLYYWLFYCSLKKTPQQFRTAANWLQNIKQEYVTKNSVAELRTLSILIADCYFLNGDFEIALKFYNEGLVLERKNFNTKCQILVYQIVLCHLNLNQLSNAIEFLKENESLKLPTNDIFWSSQVNVLRNMFNNEQFESAIEHCKILLEKPELISEKERIEIQCIYVNLCFILRKFDNIIKLTQEVSKNVEKCNFLANEKTEIKAEMIFLEAKTIFQTSQENDKIEHGLNLLQKLRSEFPGNSFIQESYIEEANIFENKFNNYVKAQQILVQLVDLFPNDDLSPIALYKASINSAKRGKEYFSESVGLLSKLIQTYQDSPLVYYAKLKQADLLKEVGDFASAEKIYDQLIEKTDSSKIPNDLDYLKFLKLKCSFSKKLDIKTQNEKIEILKELLQNKNLSQELKIEIGFFLGNVLTQLNDTKSAKIVYWDLISPFFSDHKQVDLGSTGVYWITRAIVGLASLLEKEGNVQSNSDAQKLYAFILKNQLPAKLIAEEKLKRKI